MGQSEPAMGLRNPSLIAIDYGGPKGVAYTTDGVTAHTVKSYADVFAAVRPDRGTLVVTESSFESFDPASKRSVMELAEELGLIIRVISTRMAYKVAVKTGPLKDGKPTMTDEDAARAIYAQAHRQHLKVPALPAEVPLTPKGKYIRDRAAGWPNGSADLEAVAPYADLPDEYKLAFGDGKKYADSLANAVFIAYEPGMTRSEFERAIGIYQHGYPSVFRSTIQRRNWSKGGYRIPKSVYRRGLRYLYHRMKQGLHEPATGLLNPASPGHDVP